MRRSGLKVAPTAAKVSAAASLRLTCGSRGRLSAARLPAPPPPPPRRRGYVPEGPNAEEEEYKCDGDDDDDDGGGGGGDDDDERTVRIISIKPEKRSEARCRLVRD